MAYSVIQNYLTKLRYFATHLKSEKLQALRHVPRFSGKAFNLSECPSTTFYIKIHKFMLKLTRHQLCDFKRNYFQNELGNFIKFVKLA